MRLLAALVAELAGEGDPRPARAAAEAEAIARRLSDPGLLALALTAGTMVVNYEREPERRADLAAELGRIGHEQACRSTNGTPSTSPGPRRPSSASPRSCGAAWTPDGDWPASTGWPNRRPLPGDGGDHPGGVRQVGQDHVRARRGQVRRRVAAGRDGHRAGPGGQRGLHVQRSVTDQDGGLPGKPRP